MIPIYLKLQGIYSYKTLQEIDFTKLTEASIFGIFGKVGSGKSTILEAIMLALYGEVARMKRTENRNYNIMNLDSDSLYIDFVFESGGERFRSEVKASRNRKKFDKVETFNTAFYKYEPLQGNWTPKEDFNPAKALGLTMEDFRKTVILPQNSFQDFLQLNRSDRTDMMKRLFRLEQYDLWDKVYALEVKNRSDIDFVKGSLRQIGIVDVQMLSLKENEATELDRQLKESAGHLRQNREEEKRLTTTNRKFVELNALREIQERLNTQAEAIAEKREGLERYLRYVELFKIPFFQFNNLESEIAKNKTDFEILNAALIAQRDKLQQAQSRLIILRTHFDNRGEIKRKAEDLQIISDVKKLSAQQEEKEIGLKKGAPLIQQAKDQLKSLNKEIENTTVKKNNLVEATPDLNQLYALKNWFNERQNIIIERDRLIAEAFKRSETVRIIESSKNLLINRDLPLIGLHLTDDFSLAETFARVKETLNAFNLEMEETRRQESEWNASLKFEMAAAKLIPGLPCPICGSVHHPSPLNASDVHEKLQQTVKKLIFLKKTAETAGNIAQQLETNLTNYLLRNEERKRNLTSVREQEKKDLIHLSKFIWADYNPDMPESVDEAVKKAVQWQDQIKMLDRQLNDFKTEIDKARGNIERYQDRLQILTVEKTEISAAVNAKRSLLQSFKVEDYDRMSEAELKDFLQDLIKEYDRVEKTFLAAELEVGVLQSESDVLSGKKEESEKRLLEKSNASRDLKEDISLRLKKSGMGNIEAASLILSENRNVVKEQKEMNDFYIQRDDASRQIEKLTEELKSDAFDPDRLIELVNQIAAIEKNLQEFQQKKGMLEAEITQLKRAIQETALLEDQLHGLEIRGEHIKTLKSLFREKGFVNYVSSLYLRNLCAAANDRFKKLTRQQLSLELGEDNNFKIIDVLNHGRERHIKTLSGGQTFQAALCLALALADSVQPRTGSKQNFFFLDEGFGALDRDALATVFETLKSLRQENRIVGVISHIEEMQQEMERYLVVTNGEEGSVVEMF